MWHNDQRMGRMTTGNRFGRIHESRVRIVCAHFSYMRTHSHSRALRHSYSLVIKSAVWYCVWCVSGLSMSTMISLSCFRSIFAEATATSASTAICERITKMRQNSNTAQSSTFQNDKSPSSFITSQIVSKQIARPNCAITFAIADRRSELHIMHVFSIDTNTVVC